MIVLLLSMMGVLSYHAWAQEDEGTSQGRASNNWSQYETQYEVQFQTFDATCFNNAKVAYALVNKNTHEIASLADLTQQGLEQICIYSEDLTSDTTRHRSHFYTGGWDTLVINSGSYIIGVEGVKQTYIAGEFTYVKIDTNTQIDLGTTYRTPEGSAMSAEAFKPNQLGNLPTLNICKNTGRVQMKIEYGRFPYTIYVRPHGMEDSLYRVVTFDGHQYNGNNPDRYDYKDYYTIDNLPAGDWDFYLEDGCGSGLPRSGAIVSSVSVPTLDRIEIYASSGNPSDSNVIRINSVLNNYYHIYYDSLKKYMYYRVYLGGTTPPQFKKYPWVYTNQDNLRRTRIMDTIPGLNYCNFHGQPIVYEYKFDMPSCTTFTVKDTFHYYIPNKKYFDMGTEYVIDSARTLNECGRTWYSHKDYYSIKYRSYEPDYRSTGDDDTYRRYHYTSPIKWQYFDSQGHLIKEEVMNIEEEESISTTSYLTYQEAYDYFQPTTPTFFQDVTRRLVDSLGCVLFDSTETFFFDLKEESNAPSWTVTKAGGGHCCDEMRSLTLSELNSSEFPMDTVWITLYSSPYNNFYNFSAWYDPVRKTWEVDSFNFNNGDMGYFWTQDGRSFTMQKPCLPSGPYRFHVRSNCGEYNVGINANFPDIYRTELVATPKFEVRAECSDQYVFCTQGRVVRIVYNLDPNTGQERSRIDSLTTYFEIFDGPPGGYQSGSPVRYNMQTDSIRISMPGRYIIRTYPDENAARMLCEQYEFFDTIDYAGNSVQFDFAMALLCDENDTTGTAYVHAKSGTPPYTYTLYSKKNLTGDTIMSATLDADDIFIVPSEVFEEKGIGISTQEELSCHVTDVCGSYFQVNFYPQILGDLQKTWFDGGLKADTTCEGTFVHINALSVGDIFQYEWTGPDGFYSNSSNPYLFIRRGSASGWYKVVISNISCENSILMDSIFLGVKPAPILSVGDDQTVCPGEEVHLTFVPHAGNLATPTAPVNFTVAIENAFGMIDTTFTNIPGGTLVPFTYTPTSETRIYPLVVEDAECAYHFADSGDTLILHMRSDVITPCNVITTHDTVCYGGSGHLTATLQLQGHPVDANHPTSVRWFADYNMTHELKSEILTGGFSYYDTAGLTQRTVLYVSLNQDNICPSLNGVTTNVHSMESGSLTGFHCADAIRYYDPGGRDGDYPVSGNGSYFETFQSYDGRPVAIHFDSLDLAVPSKLYIFTGTEAVYDSLIYTISYGTVPPDIILSNGPFMSLMFSPGPVSAKGWEAVVSPAPGIAIAEVLPQNIVRFADEVCHIGGDEYTPPFEGWERVVSQIVLDSLLNDPETSGVYTFQRHFTDSHGCDSLVRFDLTVGIQPVCLDTTIVILSTDTAGIVWHGKTYKENGQYYYTLAGTGDATHCDCVERLSLIVLDVKVHDNEMCEGDDALMVIEVKTPNIKRDFPDRTTIGDIYCERYVQTSTGAFTQMLFLNPEKFAAQRQFDSLTPLGVVFYVDPDVTEARVVSLTDAFRGALPWARTEVMTSVQSGSGLKTSMESSVEDFDGKSNTDEIKRTAELATDKNFQLNAPAAFFCYYFDPKAAVVPSSLDDPNTRYNTPTDWYLPSAGEVSIFRANRGIVNKTIEKLIELGYSAEYPDPPYDPDHPGYYKGSAYWSSTESNTNHQMAWFLQAKGQMNGHKTKDFTINIYDNNEEHYCVRAVKKVNL